MQLDTATPTLSGGLGTGAMRALIVDSPGALPRVGNVAVPTQTDGTTLIDVVAAPVNPLDLAIASGAFHSARHEAPYVPGSECVGVVLASDVHEPGSWMYAECHASPQSPGAMAEQVVVADSAVLSLPTGVDAVMAAAVGNAGVAAYLPLIEVARMQAGETVLVLGATGAVGQLAVQIARSRGAGQVVGVGRDAATLARLLDLGADAVVDLRADEDADSLAARMLAAAGPVDVVLDGLYGRPLEAALRACAPRARIVNIGNSAGATAELPAGVFRGQQLTLAGFAGLRTPLIAKRSALTWLWRSVEAGELSIEVRTCGLDDLPAAWQAQASSPHGKNVLVTDGVHRLTTTDTSRTATHHESEI